MGKVTKSSAVWSIVVSFIASLVVVAGSPVATVDALEAVQWAPTSPAPECVRLEGGGDGLGCTPDGGTATVGGTYESGGSFQVTTDPEGVAACGYYRSTGCHIELYDPSLVRCVYLANFDPTDVRSCSSLSTGGGTPGATRQGTCRASFGNTYVYGGDARYPEKYYTARANKVKTCTFDVAAEPPLDNLRGPTFYLVRTSVLECVEIVGGWDCTDRASVNTYRTVSEYAWIPVRGTLAPMAAFVPHLQSTPGLVSFENRSVPYADGVTTFQWDFGDGDDSTAESPSHRYELPGEYTVRLTMSNSERGQLSTTRVVEVVAPELGVGVFNPDAEFGPGERGNAYDLGDTFTARVIVAAGQGLGDITEVTHAGDLLDVPPQLEIVEGGESIDPFSLSPRGERVVDVTLKAIKPGNFTLRSTWSGVDAAGRAVGPETGEMNGKVGALEVEITLDPPSFDLDKDNNEDGEITPEDNDVEITVTVRNVTSEYTVVDIVKDPIGLTSNDEDDPSVRLFVQAVPETDPPGGDPDEYPDLGPDESFERTWTYRADDGVDAEVSVLVTGSAEGETVTAATSETINVFTTKLLEARIDLDDQVLEAGKIVRVSGNFKNVSDENPEPTTVSFAVMPTTEDNAGNGFFATPGAATAEGLKMYTLAPGEDIDLDAILQTVPVMKPPPSSGFTQLEVATAESEGPDQRRAAVAYEVVVFEYDDKDDSNPDNDEYVEVDAALVHVLEEDGFSAEHEARLAWSAQDLTESSNYISCSTELWFPDYIGCKLLRGVETFGRGMVGLLQLAGAGIGYAVSAYVQFVPAYLGALRRIVQAFYDPEVRAQLVADVAAEIQELKELGHKGLQQAPDAAETLGLLVAQAIDNSITRIDNAMQSGSVKIALGELAEIGTENLDMLLEAFVAARTLKKAMNIVGDKPTTLKTKTTNAIELESNKVLDDVDGVIAREGDRALPGSRVLPAGMDVTRIERIWRAYGASVDDIKNLLRIARDEGVIIAFRSRAPKSVELIEKLRAWPKPQGIKTKGVNDIDIKYLGYPSDWDARVFIVEPPVKYHRKGSQERADAIEAFLDQFDDLRVNGGDAGETAEEVLSRRAAVKERIETRLDEWPEMAKSMKGWREKGVNVKFEADAQGLKASAVLEQENRQIKLTKQTLNTVPGDPARAFPRRAYRVQMNGPPGFEQVFRDITGDIDFLAILTPDGRILGDTLNPIKRFLEVTKRIRIYNKMRSLVGMQHGESFSFIWSQKARTKYLKEGTNAEGGETLLAATPAGRLVTTYFDDSLSFLLGGPNKKLTDQVQTRAYFEGIFSEALSPERAFDTQTLESLQRLHSQFVGGTVAPFSASVMGRLVGLFDDDDVSDSYDREGKILRPGEAGGVEQYVEGDGAEDAWATDLSVTNVSVAGLTAGEVAELDEILAELIDGGYDPDPAPGPAGGRWVPIDAAALVAGGPISLAPFTYLTSDLDIGATTAETLSPSDLNMATGTPFLEAGDEVVIDPGGPNEERVRLDGIGPLRFATSLVNDHDFGEMVVLVSGVASEATLYPLVSARLLETRVNGSETVDGEFEGIGRLAAGSVTPVQIGGRGGVDGEAAAVALNITAIRPSDRGYVTLYPCGSDRPTTSSLNYESGAVVGNSAIVKLDGAGRVCVFTPVDTDLVLDVNAWLAEAPSFESLVSARLAETRTNGSETVDREAEGLGRLTAGSTTVVQIAGRGGVDGDADAVALNVTAIRPAGTGYITLFPCDADRPTTSSLNYAEGDIVGNSAVVSLSAAGTLCVFTLSDTDLVLDVNAWLADDALFDPLVSARLAETRTNGSETVDHEAEGLGRLGAGSVTPVQIAGRGGVHPDAAAVALNVTAIRPADRGYVTLFPCDAERPTTSSLNYAEGSVVGNSAVVKLDATGRLCVYTYSATDLVLDVNAAWMNG